MALDNVPWFIGGGAEHSPAVARLLGYAATQGATGIIQPSDLIVRALAVPGTAVRIGPGAATLYNRYPGATSQSYLVRNISDTNVEIPATGSGSGATRYIIIRVTDPQYGGQVPADVLNGPYVEAVQVSSITNLPYPFVPLAKIVQPASTGTITQAMITDLREVANPREKSIVRPNAIVASDTGLSLGATGVDGEVFPNAGGTQTIDIPDWATRVQIRAEWLGVRLPSSAGWGEYWAEFGPYARPSVRQYSTQRFNWDADETSPVYRTNWILHDDVYVPAALRGTSQVFYMKGRIVLDKVNKPTLDAKSGVVLSVRFLEVADPSTS
ncbi:minor tail protein [Arthrobacter phage VroomVroom]|uniref:Minor tail protein n=1 Tax=Arthrobacter phage VroomVroom TaxID=3049371 RepID=A0AA49FAC2_9CAUD|nr:minor tail protein [Arthrobacter phage VroomVroom]